MDESRRWGPKKRLRQMLDGGKERASFVTRPEEGLVSTPATRRLPTK
jgi:hypothetical protein